jgi:hypothetical protein
VASFERKRSSRVEGKKAGGVFIIAKEKSNAKIAKTGDKK